MQLDEPDRGFSFSKEGELDMRMNQEDELSAKQIVNRYSEKELGEIFRIYGEEKRWRKAAKAIVEARKSSPITTTLQLCQVLMRVLGFNPHKKIHPATLVFQALRIAVNKELQSIEKGIQAILPFLSKGQRGGVLSFHSLEDRIVKNIFKRAAAPEKIGKEKVSIFKLLTKKPLIPSFKSIRANVRARSAKLRFIERGL